VRTVIGVAPHELDRFGDNIDSLRTVDGDAVFRRESKEVVNMRGDYVGEVASFPGSFTKSK